MFVTESSDDKDEVDIAGAVVDLVVIELGDRFTETVELKLALVTGVVDMEHDVTGAILGEVEVTVAAFSEDVEAKLVVTTETVGDTKDVAAKATLDMAAWCLAARCLFFSLSEGPRWRGR